MPQIKIVINVQQKDFERVEKADFKVYEHHKHLKSSSESTCLRKTAHISKCVEINEALLNGTNLLCHNNIYSSSPQLYSERL